MPTTSRVSHGRDASSGPDGHLVQPQRVGAVLVVHLVGRDGVLQALAHLAPLARDGLAVEREAVTSRSSTSVAST